MARLVSGPVKFAVLKDHPDVLNVCGDPLITTNQVRIIE
jgi:hypothetical protein